MAALHCRIAEQSSAQEHALGILSALSVEEWRVAQKEDTYFGPYVTWIMEKRLPLDKSLALDVARLADHYALDSQGILVYSSSYRRDYFFQFLNNAVFEVCRMEFAFFIFVF